MIALPNPQEWIDRIEAEVSGFARVGGSLEAAADFGGQTLDLPACYVTLTDEAPGTNEIDRGVSQEVTSTATVWLVIANHPDLSESEPLPAGDALLRSLRADIFEALLAWAPCDCNPVEYAGGSRVSAVDAGLLIWREDFTTTYLLRQIP
jgi:hypothetical protein